MGEECEDITMNLIFVFYFLLLFNMGEKMSRGSWLVWLAMYSEVMFFNV